MQPSAKSWNILSLISLLFGPHLGQRSLQTSEYSDTLAPNWATVQEYYRLANRAEEPPSANRVALLTPLLTGSSGHALILESAPDDARYSYRSEKDSKVSKVSGIGTSARKRTFLPLNRSLILRLSLKSP